MNFLASIITPKLLELRQIFVQSGFDIRIAGGAVRDMLLNKAPSDVDFCTDASPEQQLAMYIHHGIKYVDTGSDFGTYTVIIDGESYEITSLRTESEHDGRHAKMSFCKDWREDASRRDLTFNAMMMDFQGVMYDYFNGADDLKAGRVVFVGDPGERMREDYLRILRFFRFYARYGSQAIDSATEAAILDCKSGLRQISVERFWKELSQIVMHPKGPVALMEMIRLGIFDELPLGDVSPEGVELMIARRIEVEDPYTRMAMLLEIESRSVDEVDSICGAMKFPSAVRDSWRRIATKCWEDREYFRMLAVDRTARQIVVETARYYGKINLAHTLALWQVPQFPNVGDALRAQGMAQGPAMGPLIKRMKEYWFDTGCSKTAAELISEVQ